MQTTELKNCVEPDWFDYNNLVANEIAEGNVGNFVNWQVVKDTMFYSAPPQMAIDFLKDLTDWDKWKEAIEEVPIGNPPYYEFHPKTNGNVVHQANHLAHFLSRTNCKLEELDTIYEFGAGYGCMCRLIYNLGYTGRYVIMDLPALIALQQWYLGKTVTGYQITYLTNSDEFTERAKGKSLLMAVWSLSEVSYLFREKILQDAYYNKVDYMLFAFQGIHNEFNNLDYFTNEVMFKHPGYRWEMLVVPHVLTNEQYHYYLFGEKL